MPTLSECLQCRGPLLDFRFPVHEQHRCTFGGQAGGGGGVDPARRRRGSGIRARAMASICCSPPESLPPGQGRENLPSRFQGPGEPWRTARRRFSFNRQIHEDAAMLRHQGEAVPSHHMWRQVPHLPAVEAGGALRLPHQAGDGAHRGCLACAVAAKQRHRILHPDRG